MGTVTVVGSAGTVIVVTSPAPGMVSVVGTGTVSASPGSVTVVGTVTVVISPAPGIVSVVVAGTVTVEYSELVMVVTSHTSWVVKVVVDTPPGSVTVVGMVIVVITPFAVTVLILPGMVDVETTCVFVLV